MKSQGRKIISSKSPSGAEFRPHHSGISAHSGGICAIFPYFKPKTISQV